jgi:pimeloyl-ACP methyl ester carboxylesterase
LRASSSARGSSASAPGRDVEDDDIEWFVRVVGGGDASSDVRASPTFAQLRYFKSALPWCMSSLMRQRTSLDAIRSLDVPTLVVYADRTVPFFREAALALARTLPNARSRMLHGAHVSALTLGADEYCDAVVAHMEAAEARAGAAKEAST